MNHYLKTFTVKDIYGNEVQIGGKEIVRAYHNLFAWLMECRFVYLFREFGQKFDKDGIKRCANYCADQAMSRIVEDASVSNPASGLEEVVMTLYKNKEI